MSSIKSLSAQYDIIDKDTVKELQGLIVRNKDKLKIMNLSYIILENINLNNTQFIGSNLFGANFKNSNLREANFAHAKLVDTNFSSSCLLKADFSQTTLNYTNFENADLIETNFNNVKGTDINFSKADLFGVDLTKILFSCDSLRLEGALYNSKTIGLDVIMTRDQFKLICDSNDQLEYLECLNKYIDYIILPTKFLEGFDPKKYGMIDISENQ